MQVRLGRSSVEEESGTEISRSTAQSVSERDVEISRNDCNRKRKYKTGVANPRAARVPPAVDWQDVFLSTNLLVLFVHTLLSHE